MLFYSKSGHRQGPLGPHDHLVYLSEDLVLLSLAEAPMGRHPAQEFLDPCQALSWTAQEYG